MGKELPSCRVCLRKCKKWTPLDSEFRDESPSLKYLCVFNACTRLDAVHGDALPQQLCSHCGNDLKTAYNFIQLAQDTDRKLRQLKNSNRQTRSGGALMANTDWNKADTFETEIHGTECIEQHSYEEDEGNVKVEFITCSRDPLEDTDEEDLNTDDHLLNPKDLKESNSGDNDRINVTESGDEDDDKPLKELFKVKDVQSDNGEDDNSSVHVGYSALNEDNLSKFYEENDLSNSPIGETSDLAISPEEQIFPQGRFKCKVCMKSYFTAAGIKAHSVVHLPKAVKTKKKSRRANRKELKDPTEKDTIQITDTDGAQANKTRKEKLPKPKKMFPCHVCGKHMISASKLRYHMVMHTGEKDFLCTQCPKAYSTIYALKHHMRTHTGERPYECKFCGDKFTRPTTLKSHMRRHTGERPYGCDICGKRFIQHSSMTTHMKLNHMAKTIPCPHCEKKYARQTDLTTHLLSHTGDKPFSCQLCPSRFIRQANLNKHMNQHHPDKSSASKKPRVGSEKSVLQSDPVAASTNITPLTTQYTLGSSDVVSNTHLTPSSSALPEMYSTSANMLPSSLIATQSSRDIIENLESIKVLNAPAPTETLQNILGQTHMMESDRFGRAIDDINRWNWSNAS